MSLMVSISGIRGIVGETLTPPNIVKYAAAYGEYCKRKHDNTPTVVIGRDGRITGKIVANLISSTLLSTGVHVRAIGICPTPTVQLAVERSDAAGGISVTASHNPIQWNGMKFMASTGMFLNRGENEELWDIAERNEARHAGWQMLGRHIADDSWIRTHIDAVLALPYVDTERIKQRKLRIVLDCVNAAGGIIVPHLLEALGCRVIEMNCDVSGVFAHLPEPVPLNLVDLASRVKMEHADLGIAVDPDVDRLVLIDEHGKPYGEEYTIASAVKFVLEKELASGREAKHPVVINLSTTRAVDDIAAAYNVPVIRTPVGEINVAEKMKEVGALIGGEGSGGIILPAVHLGRDAIAGIGLILQSLVEFGGTLSALKNTLPQYTIAKGKVELANNAVPDKVMEQIRTAAGSEGQINTDDGLRIDFPSSWVHLRKSNTEPIIRVIAEAHSREQAASLVDEYQQLICRAAG